jgi:hypothetical protein
VCISKEPGEIHIYAFMTLGYNPMDILPLPLAKARNMAIMIDGLVHYS